MIRCVCGAEIKNNIMVSSIENEDAALQSENDIVDLNNAGRDVFIAIVFTFLVSQILYGILPSNEFAGYAIWVIVQCIAIYILHQKYPLKIAKLDNIGGALKIALITGLIFYGGSTYAYLYGNLEVPHDYDLFIGYGLHHKAIFLIYLIVIIPITSEILFRGYFYRILKMRYGIFMSLLLSGFIWSAVNDFDAMSLLYGYIFTVIYEETDNLWYCMIVHSIINSSNAIFHYLLSGKLSPTGFKTQRALKG
jgi:membrane protease YdiL (CAAX protease family)